MLVYWHIVSVKSPNGDLFDPLWFCFVIVWFLVINIYFLIIYGSNPHFVVIDVKDNFYFEIYVWCVLNLEFNDVKVNNLMLELYL